MPTKRAKKKRVIQARVTPPEFYDALDAAKISGESLSTFVREATLARIHAVRERAAEVRAERDAEKRQLIEDAKARMPQSFVDAPERGAA